MMDDHGVVDHDHDDVGVRPCYYIIFITSRVTRLRPGCVRARDSGIFSEEI